jgi:hypothetical protein
VIDTLIAATGRPQGGPFLGGPGWPLDAQGKPPKNARTYPTAEPGKLIGMGAGYYQWVREAGSGNTTPGIGLASGFGTLPLFEGQMDTSNLPVGTYILKVIPGEGVNVLRGDISLGVNQNAFATAADSTAGSEIRFILEPCVPPLSPSNPNPPALETDVPVDIVLTWTPGENATSRDVYFGTVNPPPFVQNQVATSFTPPSLALNTTYYWQVREKNACGTAAGPVWSFTTEPLLVIAWRTIASHGGVDYAIELDPAATGNGSAGPTTDPREGDVTRLAFDFNAAADIVGLPLVSGSDGSSPEPFDCDPCDGTTIGLLFGPGELVNGVCYTVDLDGAIAAGFEMIGGNTSASFRVLEGDSNSNGVVNLGDALYISTKIGQPVADYPHLDLNRDGTISMADALLAKSKIGDTLAFPCP